MRDHPAPPLSVTSLAPRALVLIALCAGGAASAQTAAPPASVPGWWGGFGLGVLDENEDGNVLLSVTVRVRTPYSVGPLRVEGGVAGASNLSIFGTSASFAEAHVALGTGTSAGPVLVAVAAGPSVVAVEGRGGGVAPGLYVGAQVQLAVFPAFGLGVEGYANANAEMPVVGGGLAFSFGRLPARAAVPNPPPRPRPAR